MTLLEYVLVVTEGSGAAKLPVVILDLTKILFWVSIRFTIMVEASKDFIIL